MRTRGKRLTALAILFSLTALPVLVYAQAQVSPVQAEPQAAIGVSTHQQRKLPLRNTLNSRDIGGYRASDGRRVKWGVLFRSDSLAGLDEGDWLALQRLGLLAITDFRSKSERVEAPYQLPPGWPALQRHTLAINNPGVDVAELGRKFYAGELSEKELLALTDRRAYVDDPALSNAWGAWVRDLAAPGALPQLFHCTAGKDRTGFAAAIVLLTLGVSKEEVMQDFLLSNEYLAPKIDRGVTQILARTATDIDPDILRQVLGVSPRSLTDAFAAMESRYGSIDGYIEQGLGIDADTRARLQALLLE